MIETLVALAEPNRLRIVELLGTGERTVTEIGTVLRLRQPQVSKHLQVLKGAGLVAVKPVAQQRIYALSAQPLRELHNWLDRYRQVWDERFAALDEVLTDLEKPKE